MRMRLADQALEELRKEVDAIIVIPNDRLLTTVSKETTAKSAFAMCDEILKQAVEGISDLITTPGTINIDFADIRAVLENAGTALMGIGYAQGEKRAEEAAKAAINSPLLDISTNGAKGVLFSIAGGDDLTMFEIQDAAKVITESVDPNAKIIFGTVNDEKLKKGEIKITVIASSFPETVNRKSLFQGSDERIVDTSMNQTPRGKIFNGFTSAATVQTSTPVIEQKDLSQQPVQKAEEPAQATKKIIDDSDDDWGAVPAFLRRSKIK
jgi:cell division protein FtsZ